MKKKIVVIGGGNGSAIALMALKENRDLFDISAVVSMSDSGGSSGRLRKEFNVLPPGDIMRAVLALSKHDYILLRQIFYRPRFNGLGKLDGHNLGNLFLVLADKYGEDFMKAVRALEQSVEAIGHAFPVTLDKADLCVRLNNGQVIKKEAAIDKPMYDRKLKIADAWLEPEAKIYPEARLALERADYILLAPGSLYTSVISILLVKGVKEVMAASHAKIIGVVQNSFEGKGETGPECLSERVKQVEKYLPRKMDLLIYNNQKLSKAQREYYAEKNWIVMKKDKENLPGRALKGASFERKKGGTCSLKLGRILKQEIKKI